VRLLPDKWSALLLFPGQHGGWQILQPNCWMGMMMKTHVDRQRCHAKAELVFGEKVVCCLPVGHEALGADHLACSEDLVAEHGTMCPTNS